MMTVTAQPGSRPPCEDGPVVLDRLPLPGEEQVRQGWPVGGTSFDNDASNKLAEELAERLKRDGHAVEEIDGLTVNVETMFILGP